MNPFLLLLFEAGVNIAKAHVKNKTAGEILSTTSFIMDAAKAIDDLYQEENGEPLDWSTIRHHQHLPPPGELPETADPGSEPVPTPIEEIAEPGEGEAAEADAAAGPEDPPGE